jgi:hypothetical protein
VVFGGLGTTQWLGDTWEWDGSRWTVLSPGIAPSARSGHGLVFDVGRGRVVSVGGLSPSGASSEVWEWDGANWELRFQPPRPPGRQQHGLVYDSRRNRTLLFGGYFTLSQPLFSDTWEWDGLQWSERHPVQRPPARFGHGCVFDPARARAIVFGGADRLGVFADTWEWNGDDWLRFTPVSSPSPRHLPALAFDSARGRTVLFGGISDLFNGRLLVDTWEWDGKDWVERFPAQSPPACGPMAYDAARKRSVLITLITFETWEWDGTDWFRRFPRDRPSPVASAGIAYDEARSRIILFGGAAGSSTSDATWEWDGDNWLLRSRTGPSSRFGSGLAYDTQRGRAVLFGGLGQGRSNSDTWEYAPVQPAAYAAFGTGCAGSAGTPTLGSLPGQLPWLGDQFTLELTSLPPGNSALVWLGTSRTQWETVRLPLDLASAGMPGCSLRVSPDFALPVFNRTGSAFLPLWLPSDPALLGASFFTQGLTVDRSANPLGLSVSNAGEGRLGGR